jgi:ribulose-phosphate 3-epimerase
MEEDKVFQKVSQLIRIRNENNLKFLIGVDGGVNASNIKKLEDAGVEIAYCGGAVFNGKVENNLKELNYVSQNK